MPEEKILTMHPGNKPGRSISKRKYEQMKKAIISLLQQGDLSLSEIISTLEISLKDTFFDNISWFAEIVILDLEARGIISKLDKYHLV